MAWADPGGGTGGRHVVSQAWKGRRSPFLPGDLFLCRPSSSCAQSSSPSPPTAPRPSPLPLAWPWPSGGGTGGTAPLLLGSCNPIPGAGRPRARVGGGWAGPGGLGFRASRWEGAWKEQMPPLPTGRRAAARPPPGPQLPPPPTRRGLGRGGGGIWVTCPSRTLGDTALASQKAPVPRKPPAFLYSPG
jgi:hypothetical protein